MTIAAMKQALEALEIGQDAFSQSFSGYGFFRPGNPHNFFPDPECCTPTEIQNHSAACEAYDKGAYVPEHGDGWIGPDLHVTKAPWGIGTYTDECQQTTEAITALRTAIYEQEKCEPVAWQHRQRGPAEENWQEWRTVGHTPQGPESRTFQMRPLFAHPAPVPAGWQLVPVEPTEAMLHAFNTSSYTPSCYAALLAAAPKPER